MKRKKNKLFHLSDQPISSFQKLENRFQNSSPRFKICILILLFFVWLIFQIVYLINTGSAGLFLEQIHTQIRLDNTNSSDNKSTYLIAKGKIVGYFPGEHNNLGQVVLRFNTQKKSIKDQITFRIKELAVNQEDDKWYYEKTYETNQILTDKLFSFGFPLINDSKEKNYKFEIESLSGVPGEALLLSDIKPASLSRYFFTKRQIFTNYKVLTYFVWHKFGSIVQDPNFQINIVTYALPIIFLGFVMFTSTIYQPLLLILIFSTCMEIFSNANNISLVLMTMLLWILMFVKYRIGSGVVSFLILANLLIAPILFIFGNQIAANKTSIWAFLFLLILPYLLIYENNNQEKLKSLFTVWNEFTQTVKEIWGIVEFFGNEATSISVQTIQTTRGIIMVIVKGGINLSTEKIAKSKTRIGVIWASSGKDGKLEIKQIIVTSPGMVKLLFNLSKIIREVLKISPYLISIWLIWEIYGQSSHYIHFYDNFFPYNQRKLFTDHTGIYIAGWWIIVVGIALYVQIRNQFRKKQLLTIVLSLLFLFWGGQIIYNKTTGKFSSNVYIWKISPKRVTLWDEVTIKGRNFKDLPWYGELTVAGVKHRILKWTDKEIIFQAEPGKTKSGQIRVVNIYGKESPPVDIEVYDFFTKELVK